VGVRDLGDTLVGRILFADERLRPTTAGSDAPTADRRVQASVAAGLEHQAVAYRQLGSSAQELAALEELTRRFASSTRPDVARAVSFALYRQALRLERLGDEPEALLRYRAFCERVNDTDDRELRGWWVRASLRWAAILARSGAPAEAMSVLDDAVQQLAIVDADDTQGWAGLMLARADALHDVQRSTESLVVLDAIVERLDRSGEPDARKLIAHALIAKAAILAVLGRVDDVAPVMELLVEEFAEPALEALDERINQLSGSPDPFARLALAQALIVKAGILHDLGRDDEARATRKQLVAEFKRDTDPRLAALVAATRDML
jgi:tetratricopeptide (TPR) repeat protein